MTRLVALFSFIVGLVFAASALAGIYAHISANWNDSSAVDIVALSDHSFNGSVSDSCALAGGPPAVTKTHPLDSWAYDPVAHQYTDEVVFDMSAAGSGANCTITVMSGKKLLAEQSYVSV